MHFVLIDRFIEITPASRAVAIKTFSPDDELFGDHFPGTPIVPGVLLTEAMGQTGGWLVAATLRFTQWPILTMISHAKFRRLVRPGEPVQLEATIRSAHPTRYEITAEATVAGRRAADARLILQPVLIPMSEDAALAFGRWTRATFRRLGGEELLGGPPVGDAGD